MLTMLRQVRMRALAAVAGLTLTAALVAHAQTTLTGKWQGQTNAGATIVLDLIVKGTVLSGTLTRDDVSSAIADGTVSKNTFTFKAKLGDQVEGLSGELVDDQIKIWLDRQGASTAIVLKRVTTALPD